MINAKNAGTADSMSSMSTFAKFLSIRTPTKIKAGAVAQPGTILATGLKNKQSAKQMDTTTPVRPGCNKKYAEEFNHWR